MMDVVDEEGWCGAEEITAPGRRASVKRIKSGRRKSRAVASAPHASESGRAARGRTAGQGAAGYSGAAGALRVRVGRWHGRAQGGGGGGAHQRQATMRAIDCWVVARFALGYRLRKCFFHSSGFPKIEKVAVGYRDRTFSLFLKSRPGLGQSSFQEGTISRKSSLPGTSGIS